MTTSLSHSGIGGPPRPGSVSQPRVVALDWPRLVATFMHPVKLAILEAHLRIQAPIPPAGLMKMLPSPEAGYGVLLFHLEDLRRRGLLDRAVERGVRSFDWNALVDAYIHPAKVAILEALAWVEHPLSPAEMSRQFGFPPFNLGVLAYHVRTLVDRGIVEPVYSRGVRGSRETYYFFAS
jgi:hypothetical protein